MRLLALLTLLLLPVSAFAQSVPPMPQGGNITVIPNSLGASYWSSNGGSVDVIGTEPGQQMYFSHDRFGNANGMGFINQPFVERPLTVPESLRPSSRPSYQSDADIAHEACVALGRC